MAEGKQEFEEGRACSLDFSFLDVKLSEQEVREEEVVGSSELGQVKGSRRGMRPEIPLPTPPHHLHPIICRSAIHLLLLLLPLALLQPRALGILKLPDLVVP